MQTVARGRPAPRKGSDADGLGRVSARCPESRCRSAPFSVHGLLCDPRGESLMEAMKDAKPDAPTPQVTPGGAVAAGLAGAPKRGDPAGVAGR